MVTGEQLTLGVFGSTVELAPSGLPAAREDGKRCEACGAPITRFLALSVCPPCLIERDRDRRPAGVAA